MSRVKLKIAIIFLHIMHKFIYEFVFLWLFIVFLTLFCALFAFINRSFVFVCRRKDSIGSDLFLIHNSFYINKMNVYDASPVYSLRPLGNKGPATAAQKGGNCQ